MDLQRYSHAFLPSLRLSISLEYGFAMHSIFETLDLITDRVTLDNTMCTPATMACLPLHALFTDIPTDHWILTRRPNILLVDHFFLFGPIRRCLRPRTRGDQPIFPRLSARLWQDLMVNNSLTYATRFVETLVNPPESLGLFDNSFWRMSSLHLPLLFRHSRGKGFGICLSDLIPAPSDSSDTCPFCHASQESPSHLPVECPLKWAVWFEVLLRIVPYLHFEPADVLDVLYSLAMYDHISPSALFTTCAATALAIWQSHWSSVIDNIPFSLTSVLAKVQKLL
ncbi:hypothetical protein BD560DRAFT_448405 [Blakeslea trispora]|nr:hypothetical protein BD560DRAFT_448405 [Blakeslea trispora]